MKVLITCALPYANGAIHFGHLAGTCLPSDVFARYSRMRGDDVLYVCGSDEYGLAITLAAQLAKRSPQEHVDIYHPQNQDLFKRLNFSFDNYSRTTWKGHVKPVQEFFLDLHRNGYIEKKTAKHLYSKEDNQFLADRYVQGICPQCGFENARGDECPSCGACYEVCDLLEPRSKLTGHSLELKDSTHWYLRLDLFKDRLKKWLDGKEWKSNVLNFIRPYIENLRPRAITRDTHWGIPVPLDDAKGKVLYVWFDAPIGYISASMQWAQDKGEPEKWKDYWYDSNTKFVQFLGKDNIPFHAVIFPAMIMGQDQPLKLVDEMPANEFYNLEGKKFSKSDGWTIDLSNVLDEFNADQVRYMIASTAPENSDSEFTWKEFQVRTNSELVGKWGNFIHRTLSFIHQVYGDLESKIPFPHCYELNEEDHLFVEQVACLVEECQQAYETYRLREVTRLIMHLAQKCNVYFDQKKPWKMAKDPLLTQSLSTTLYLCLKAIMNLVALSSPIMPAKCQEVWEMLGFENRLESQNWNDLAKLNPSKDQMISLSKPLFKKIEDSQVQVKKELLIQQSQLKTREQALPLKKDISMDLFKSCDIRVGKVLSAQKIAKSKKLLLLQVEISGTKRQIVSAIAKDYQPHEIEGRYLGVLCNIPKINILGHESNGMILTAMSKKKSAVIFFSEAMADCPIG